MQNLKNIFKDLDMFAQPISLFFYQKSKFQTIKGGFFSITMVILIIALSVNMFSSIIYRTNINFSSVNEIYASPPLLSLKNRFAISLYPDIFYANSGNKRYFDYILGLGTWSLDSSGNYTLKEKYFNYTTCNNSHFPMFSKNQFIQSGLSGSLCPSDPNQEFDISGTYDGASNYNFIEITVKKCVSKNDLDICANNSEISDLLKMNGGLIYVNLEIINNIANFSNYDQPFTPFVDLATNLISLGNYKQQEIYMTPATMLTDNTRWFTMMSSADNLLETKDFIYERKTDIFMNNEPLMNGDDEVYFSMFLESGSIGIIYKRDYDTFDNYLQTIGSYYSILFVFFAKLSYFFNKGKLTLKIAKNLYDFEKKTNMHKRNLKNPFERLYNFIFQSKTFNYNKTVIKETVSKEMDIIHILMGLQEMEFFKKIFFSKDQNKLINFLAQPKFKNQLKINSKYDIIYSQKLAKKNIAKRKSRTKCIVDQEKKILEVEKCIKNLKNDKNELSQKILRFVDFGTIHRFKTAKNISIYPEDCFKPTKLNFFKINQSDHEKMKKDRIFL